MVKLSKTSKLDGIKSWSLEAVETCPGSADGHGGLVDACKGCYARTGMYVMKQVKAPRAFNKDDWKRDNFVSDFVDALKKEKFFRWFDSGDCYSLSLAEKIFEIMQKTPHVKHWFPTRMLKFDKFKPIIEKMNSLPNVAVRFSSDSITGEFNETHGSTIFPAEQGVPSGAFKCSAYEHDGKCSGCRACYDKSVKVIAYPQHGRKMKKVFMMKLG